MGNCWCEAESPCGSHEERTELLKEGSKTSGAPERVVVGTCGPEDGEDMSQATDKEAKEGQEEQQQTYRNKEGEPNNTQGNGHLQKENLQEEKDSQSEEQAEEKKDGAAERCTLNLPQEGTSTPEGLAAAQEQETGREDPTAGQEKVSDPVSPEPESSRPESLPHPETNAPTDDSAASGSHAAPGEDAVGAAAKPSEELPRNNEALSEPNALEASIPAVSQETNTDAPGCSVDSEVVDPKSHFIPQPPLSESERSQAREKLDSVGSNEKPAVAPAAEAKDSLKSDQEEKTDLKVSSSAKDTVEETSKTVPEEEGEEGKKQEDEDGTLPQTEVPPAESGILENPGKEEQSKTDDRPAAGEQDDLDDSEEDLYRGEEELSASLSHKPRPTSESEILKVQDSCSLSPAVDILSYSEREWKGNTAKSALIRKGYKEMSTEFSHLRRVRGDNYCALRATLFQVLSHSDQVPQWLQEDTVLLLPKQLEAQEGLISQWRFPGQSVHGDSIGDPTERLKGYMELLRKTWQEAAGCPSAAERQKLCERLFQGEEEELGMLEALKLLMLGRASELHDRMQVGEDVPLFCWLLFARDSSGCPRSFLSNHLRHVGLSAGLEQVEMFLLGYALQHTIQVYRLYKANTEEFVTFYPDDHRDDWPSVCLVTEDDRHYNVPVAETAEPSEEPTSS